MKRKAESLDTPPLISDLVLRHIVRYLKSEETNGDSQHGSLWINLGWDVSEGDGSIIEYVREIVEVETQHLPDRLKFLAWWQSPYSIGFQAALVSSLDANPGEFEGVSSLENEWIERTLADYLLERLLELAESAYNQH